MAIIKHVFITNKIEDKYMVVILDLKSMEIFIWNRKCAT